MSIKKIVSSLLIALCGINLLLAYDEVTMVGSTTVLPIAQATSEKFMDLNKDTDISVRGGGSGVGVSALIEGRCDIANCSREMKPSEIEKAKSKGVSPKANIVAMDGIAVIINKNNSIKNLSIEQLRGIYTGQITNWKNLGGKDQKIVVISRDTASGTYEAFGHLVLGDLKVAPFALLEASNKGVFSIIEKTPGAIGYVGVAYAKGNVKVITVNNIKCSKENILSSKYPLSRALFMYTNGAPKGSVKKYIDFVLSPAGQKIVEEVGYIGLK
jgi:phosphate transport system substrate-binding protein